MSAHANECVSHGEGLCEEGEEEGGERERERDLCDTAMSDGRRIEGDKGFRPLHAVDEDKRSTPNHPAGVLISWVPLDVLGEWATKDGTRKLEQSTAYADTG